MPRLSLRRPVLRVSSGLPTLWHRATLVTLVCVLAGNGIPAMAQTGDVPLWGVHGVVYAMARSGNTLYLAGSMSDVGPNTGGGVAVDPRTGALQAPFARVCGELDAVVPDGAGGWYIGGRFTAVEGQPRANLAHILADGTVAPWNPGVAGATVRINVPDVVYRTPGVDAMVRIGQTIYIGGLFTTVAGETRSDIAALDGETGALIAWRPEANGEVRALAARGRSLYAGGAFTRIGSADRAHLAALDLDTGAASEWNPGADGRVLCLAIGGATLYAGGEFDHVGGVPRNSIAAVDLRTASVTAWDPALGPKRRYIAHGSWIWPWVSAIALQGHTVYLGGYFDESGGLVRRGLVALDAKTGEPTGFEAGISHASLRPSVNALAVHGGTLYVGGTFETLAATPRGFLGALDGATGRLEEWNPRPDDDVEAIVVDGASIYVGGRFTSLRDWQPHRGAAAIDLTTGRAASWSPEIDGDVTGIGVIGDTVYLAGLFNHVNGIPRHDIAAVDADTGALLAWDPGPLGPIGVSAGGYAMAIRDRSIFVGGYFFGLGGQDRNYVAELDPVTAAATPWNAYPDGSCTVILPTEDAIYLGGGFNDLGGGHRPHLGAVDPLTGTLLPWSPRPGDAYPYLYPQLFALARHEGTTYVGGIFGSMGGEPRNDLAAVDASTGAVLPWAPDPNGPIETIAAMGRTIWVGGTFGTIAGTSRAYLAGFDAGSGAPTGVDARLDGFVSDLVASGDTLFVGGAFHSVHGFPHSGVAVLLPGSPRAAVPMAARTSEAPALAWIGPRPVRGRGAIEFTLPRESPARLAIFDLQGRRVAVPLDRAWTAAGIHRIELDTTGWAPAIYLCRLEACGVSVTQKIVVIR